MRRKAIRAGQGPPASPARHSGWLPGAILVALLVVAVVALALPLWRAGRAPAHPNVLLITIDTLRADHVGAYGYALPTTPTLDQLAREGTRFAQGQTPVPLTGPSHATILTGLYPPIHGLRDNELFALEPRHTTLAAILKARGYRTAAFVGGYPVTSAFGFGRGFDEFHDAFRQAGRPERPANEVADEVLDWLSKPGSGGPFFAWLHFYDPHAPYVPPPPYAGAFTQSAYDGEIAFVDAEIGRVLEGLRRIRQYPHTLVVVVSDHGEGLGEHGEGTHGMLIYESTLRVPVVMAGPGVPANRVVADRVGTVDILPTILALLRFDIPQGLAGRSLRPAFEGQPLPATPLYAESLLGRLACRWATLRAWTDDGWKLVDGANAELFHLVEDPGETRDRARDEPERVARLREGLHRLLLAGDVAHTTPLSTEQEEQLRSLGYVAGSGGAGAMDEPGLPDPRTHSGLYDRLQELVTVTDTAAAAVLPEAQAIAGRDPGNPSAQFTLGLVAQRAGNRELAVAAYRRTLDLDPRPTVLDFYGRLLRDMGRLEESERHLRLALQRSTPYEARIRLNLAETLHAAGKVREAQQLVGEVLEKDPSNVAAQQIMARMMFARDQHP